MPSISILLNFERCCDLENKLKEKYNVIERLKQEVAFAQKYRKRQEEVIRQKNENDFLKEKVFIFFLLIK